MPPTPKLPVSPSIDIEEHGEVVYASATTRVVRVGVGPDRWVRKDYLGPAAGKRLQIERDMLVRLAGVEGVGQLAEGHGAADFLALRHCEVTTLSQVLRDGRLAPDSVLDMAARLARILAEVHRAGVIHRDINPANIVVAATGELALIDFDLAVLAEHQAVASDGHLVGTLGYLAPEQTGRTGRAVDQRADLYALGATLYEMAAGRLPFQGEDALALIHDHLVREPEVPSQVDARVPQALSEIILRLLAKAPEHRYENLEQRVQARTRELEETQAQLVATARRAGKAEIANNVLHNVGNVLNSINVSANVVRGTIENSRIDGLARAVALMNEHQHEFGQFIESSPRGKVLLGYLNTLVTVLRSERDHAIADLDRLARSVEHITYVVSSQQSHAGPSSVLELTSPHDVLDEALRLCGDSIQRHAVAVVRRYGDVPGTTLDKQRLLQILVNLIVNAAQAMEHVPQASRLLTLQCESTGDERGANLRITVKDQGEGILPENLVRIFAHGFTTRASGHGFGLHSSALAALEIGGKLTAHSEGLGHGAAFILDVPITPGLRPSPPVPQDGTPGA